MYTDMTTSCTWSNSTCNKVNSSQFMYLSYNISSFSEWYKYFENCSDFKSQSSMKSYCGSLLMINIPFTLELPYSNGFYGLKNLYCRWTALNTEPSNVLLVNYSRYVRENIKSRLKIMISIF